MNLLNLIYFFLIPIIGTSAKHVKIVGGENVDIKSFPYAVSLRYYKRNQHFCGGAIISQWHVITAAHCLHKKEHRYPNIKLYTGSTTSSRTNGSRFDIANVFIHPQYGVVKSESIKEHHDIAIVMTTVKIEFNEFQNKIKLPTTSVIGNKVGTLVGWGAKSFTGNEVSEELQRIQMAIFHNADCQRCIPFALQEEQFCAFHSDNTGASVGDSGTPLTINDELVGIVSFSCGSTDEYPDIYTRIYSYLGFINDILKKQYFKCFDKQCSV